MKLLGLWDSSRNLDGMLIPSYAHISICDWDTEDPKQDGRWTTQRHMVPSAQVRLRIASAISLSTYSLV